MLWKQHKVDDSHNDMPLIYYIEGHSQQFGRPEFALITDRRFGTISFGLYTSGELKFRNRVFPHKVGLIVTNLDVIGVIEDEEMFGKLYDGDSIRLCLLLALEVIFMGLKKDHKYVPTYTLVGFVFAFQVWILESFEGCNRWWINHPQVIPRALGWSKKSIFKRSDCCYLFAQESRTTTDIRPTRAEYESSWWIHSNAFFSTTRSQASGHRTSHPFSSLSFKVGEVTQTSVLALERNHKLGRLQFNKDLSRLSSDFLESLNIIFQDLIDPHDLDEDIDNDYLVEEELRLCLEEERMCSEQEKRIQQEKSFRQEEAKKMRLEEEKKLQIVELNTRKRLEFMNSTHVRNILGKFTPTMRNDVHSVTGKTKPKESWVKIKKYRQNLNDPSLAELLKKVKPWVEHIDLWVDYMWHGRHENAKWAIVSCYFVQLILQNIMPLVYANGDKEARANVRDANFLHVSTVLAESYKLLKKLQDYELEKCRELMKSISETQLKVLKKISFIAKLRRQCSSGEVVTIMGGIFGDYGVWVCIFLYRLGHGLSLDVEDPVDVALAYHEKMTNEKAENYFLFEVNYDGFFMEYPLRCSLERGLTIVKGDGGMNKMYDMGETYGLIELYIAHIPKNLAEYYYKNLTFDAADDDVFCKVKTHEKRIVADVFVLHDNWEYEGLSLDGYIDVGGSSTCSDLARQYKTKINKLSKGRGKRVLVGAKNRRMGSLIALNEHEGDDDLQVTTQVSLTVGSSNNDVKAVD
ncbi:hypothetical protein Tco_1044958 [Tanacetum coccineum]|uniref:Uncharacterized protein n=1 Tax=Tanacetum coccineum TaxID=301880 RepID=A0ABQ5GTW8_9ASTR